MLVEDTVAFWQGLKDAGLLEEVVEEFQKEVKETLKGLQDRIQQPPLQVNGQCHLVLILRKSLHLLNVNLSVLLWRSLTALPEI